MQVVAFSGGKDSTALALRLAEVGERFDLLFTPTGREFPEVLEHIALVSRLTGATLNCRTAGIGFTELIRRHRMLPSHHARWCTRELKIEPAKAFLLEHPGSTLLVGLRADEEERVGMFGDFAEYRYPLREWDWGLTEVQSYLSSRHVKVPARTDCDWCYDQRLGEWWLLWSEHNDRFYRAEALEEEIGGTFRSPSRDTWPASLRDLRRRFEAGDKPRGLKSLLMARDSQDNHGSRCRVCSL